MDNLDSTSGNRPPAETQNPVIMLKRVILHIITSRNHSHQVEITTKFYWTSRK